MATQLEDDTDYEDNPDLDLEGNDEGGEDEAGETEGDDDTENGDDEQGDDGESDEVVISFGGEDIRDEDEPEHITDLRRRYRENRRELEELRASRAPAEDQVGQKPSLNDYYSNGSEDPEGDYERDLSSWIERNRNAEARRQQQQEAAEAARKEWEEDQAHFADQRDKLGVRDFDGAEQQVRDALDEAQWAILVQASKNKAALVYGLGKNRTKLDALVKEKNYAKFAAEVGRLDMETRVSRKPTTKPEGTVKGSGTFSGAGASNAKRAKIEAAAMQSGDFSALVRFDRNKGAN